MSKAVPNPRFAYLSQGEIVDLGLTEVYAEQARKQTANTEDRAKERREAFKDRERNKRIG